MDLAGRDVQVDVVEDLLFLDRCANALNGKQGIGFVSHVYFLSRLSIRMELGGANKTSC